MLEKKCESEGNAFNINEDHNGPFQTSHSDLPANSWEDKEREIHLKVPVEFDYGENLKYLANALFILEEIVYIKHYP